MTSSEPGERRAAGEQIVREMFDETFLRRNMVAPAEGTGPGADMARLALEQCFGGIWSRPGLDRRSRSLVTLGVLMALGHQWEVRNHVLGALANGLTSEEILEAVLQTAPYIGLPAAGQAMTTAARALEEA
ncbi:MULTISPECIES: carboxymuconolactone decarboxylase family protein [Streptomyces]|uniref:Carboxymuconolactone decarboxylase family protein n=1 Tax=Streptomyces caniscabiei TaxID=2746961 RepID=A0ABU4MR16_9ACTN|nr:MULTISPECIES: carboxymuconolactone decarboxylase family protein [Streptomyces]MBE4734229.1 carboxymuconolactone decarboxylase family protein [Streptomyces caniscabiei]MBE4759163.1 carboxymuconolactone decarboxylase family protein [Streptomyces caniscabiei]MBE4773228.1 carboxymuconolactone decarboxylase family protein [Streptomyces caniscabiei]MBE4783615.1 carboxymuconolactone decarboxylase family protein [Streptomyces caniscabiei]MBE4792919.1 carboxymuconolactone decarboxylase family protei